MLRIPMAFPGEIGVSFLRALSTRILCSGKVHSKVLGGIFGVSKGKPLLRELTRNVGTLFCVTDVGQVYLEDCDLGGHSIKSGNWRVGMESPPGPNNLMNLSLLQLLQSRFTYYSLFNSCLFLALPLALPQNPKTLSLPLFCP